MPIVFTTFRLRVDVRHGAVVRVCDPDTVFTVGDGDRARSDRHVAYEPGRLPVDHRRRIGSDDDCRSASPRQLEHSRGCGASQKERTEDGKQACSPAQGALPELRSHGGLGRRRQLLLPAADRHDAGTVGGPRRREVGA